MKNEKLAFIDAARGIAIILVVMVHTSQSIPLPSLVKDLMGLGAFGVQLFFIASAYTMCLSVERLKITSNNYKIDFGIKRYFRIAPLYYIAIATYFLVSMVMLAMKNGKFQMPALYSLKNIFANVFFLHGFYPPANNNIVPGGWSIGTEMAFYLIFPILFTLFSYCKNLWSYLLFFVFSIALSYLFYIVTLGKYTEYPLFVYFNLFNQIPVFVLGMILYKLRPIKFSKITGFLVLVFIFIIILSSIYIPVDIPPFIKPVYVSFSFSLLIIYLQNINPIGILQKIGKYSYSIYIYHFLFAWYLIRFIFKLYPHFLLNSILYSILFYVVYTIMTILISFQLGRLTYDLIEKPFINLGNWLIKIKNK